MQKLAVAFAAAVVLSTAGPAIAQDYRIAYGDLDLGSTQGAVQLDRRIDRAARNACGGMAAMATLQCIGRFRAEAMRNLPTASREDYVRARGTRVMAMVPVIYG